MIEVTTTTAVDARAEILDPAREHPVVCATVPSVRAADRRVSSCTRYADLDVGLADLSVVILAHRFRTTRVVTFDERHFRAIQPLGDGSFILLPVDG